MRNRLLPVLLVTALSVAVAGCLFDADSNEKGGGTMKVEMRAAPNTTLDKLKKAFEGPGVTITKATMDERQNAVVELKFDDLRQLGALKQFDSTKFALTEDAKEKTRTASATVKAAKPVTLPEDQIKYYGKDITVSVTLPGEIVKTDGKKKGKTVSWTVPLNTVLSGKETSFSATYKHSGEPLAAVPAAAATTPSGAAPAKAPAAATPATK